jgi:glycosyltransferase involved in cell wall biosynthesis
MDAVSVVIAAYNGARTIEETLRSCLDQSEPAAEVIVVDDASTDDTAERVQRLDSPGVPLRLLRRQRNSGSPAAPYNQGIDAASSPVVALLDQDDIWHRDKLKYSRLALARFPDVGLVFADCRSFEESTPDRQTTVSGVAARRLSQHEAVSLALQGQFTLTMSNMVLCKSAWRRAGRFPEDFRISTDYAFLARLLSARIVVAHIPAALVFYRVSPDSVWLKSNYLERNRERFATVDFLCRRFANPDARTTSRKLGEQLYDLADQAARRAAFAQSLWFYGWSLRHKQAPLRVLRASARTAMKWIFGK